MVTSSSAAPKWHTSVFKVVRQRRITDGGAEAAGNTRAYIVAELLRFDPLPVVELVGVQAYALLVVAKVAAIEEEEQLVALPFVRCPVDRDQALWLAVEAEFLAHFAAAGGGGGFSALDVAAGDVPGVLVGGVDEQDPAGTVEEQGAGGDARGREGTARVRHSPEGTAAYATRWSRRARLSRATLRGPRWLRSQESTSWRLMAWCLICSGASSSASSMTPRASSRRLRAL